MFIATNHPLKYCSLRQERIGFPIGQCANCCAPTERELNSLMSAIHISPRWGEIREHQLVARQT